MQFTDVAQNLYSPQDVMKHGLGFLSINAYGKSNQWQTTEFHKHYGSNPLTAAFAKFERCVSHNGKSSCARKAKHGQIQIF
jgi:hypothetical protein